MERRDLFDLLTLKLRTRRFIVGNNMNLSEFGGRAGVLFFLLSIGFFLNACDGDLRPTLPNGNGISQTPPSSSNCGTAVVAIPTVGAGVNAPAASAPATTFSTGFKNGVGVGYVIRNTTDWQAFYNPYPAPTPPVNFTSQMILVVIYQGCFDQPQFSSVCSDPSQVTVDLQNHMLPLNCNVVLTPGNFLAVAVATSSLPVVWQLSNI